MKTTKKNNILHRKHAKPILIDYFFQKNEIAKPIVIFCHGYKGFKDWGAWDLVANAFAEANMFFVKFNFSHNGGTIEEPIDFPDLEAFGENNYTTELNDLEAVINYLTAADFPFAGELNINDITLIGHSRGGGIVTIKASENSKITKLVTWAGVSDYASRFPQGKALTQWKEEGVMYVQNGRTKQQMPHYFQFFEDFKANEERLNIQKATTNIQIPHLIVHGSDDEAVSLSEAEKLHQWNPDSILHKVATAGHVFGAKHPWNQEKMPLLLENITETTINFIKNS